MKRFVVISLVLACVVCFSTCRRTTTKSKACDILLFQDGNNTWEIKGLIITGTYAKGSNVSSISPKIDVSDGATVLPRSGDLQDFSNNAEITYVVTAENGKTTKTYKAKAIVLD